MTKHDGKQSTHSRGAIWLGVGLFHSWSSMWVIASSLHLPRTYAFRTTLLNPCSSTCACAAAITAAAFGSLKPQPVFPFCKLAASAEQTPSPVAAT